MKLNFFHANLTGIEAENLLLEKGNNGDFLIRPSENSPDNYTLTTRQNDKVVHIKILNNGDYFSIGSNNSEGFATLAELVDYFYNNDPGGPKIKEKHGDIIDLNKIFPCKDLYFQRCYHGDLSTKESEDLLVNQKCGSFLIRNSQSKPGKLVLSVVRSNITKSINSSILPPNLAKSINSSILPLSSDSNEQTTISHVYIRIQNGQYDLGDGPKFNDLTDLLNYCKSHPMIDNTGAILKFLYPINVTNMKALTLPKYVQTILKTPPNLNISLTPSSSKKFCDSKKEGGAFTLNGFNHEYECLRKLTNKYLLPRFEGSLPENNNKNRYRNILPFDYTRVKLNLDDYYSSGSNDPQKGRNSTKPMSDYINANYILPETYVETNIPFKFLSAFNAYNTKHNSNSTNHHLSSSSPNRSFNVPPTPPLPSNDHVTQLLTPDTNWYIATQGPLKSTIQDFWQMIWGEKSQIIVMVTREVEGETIKCYRYWPDLGKSCEYGNLLVTNTAEHLVQAVLDRPSIFQSKSQDYKANLSIIPEDCDVVRELLVHPSRNKQNPLKVYHFQCRTWPDHEAPKSPDLVLKFLKAVNLTKESLRKCFLSCSNTPSSSKLTNSTATQMGISYTGQPPPPPLIDIEGSGHYKLLLPYKPGPLVVHCSAGIGRAGSFITLDMIYNSIRAKGIENTDIDVQSIVYWIRLQRSGMVQTLKQYTFIYAALAKLITDRNTYFTDNKV